MSTFIQLNSGILVDYTRPENARFTWKDLALGMATINRFLGQLNRPLNLVEHSVRVADLVPDEFRLDALLHDVGEVFVGDIPAPLKKFLANRGETTLVELEGKFERRVRAVLRNHCELLLENFPDEMPEQSKQAVRRADLAACRFEAETNFDTITEAWTENLPETGYEYGVGGSATYLLHTPGTSVHRTLTRVEWAHWWLWEIQQCLPKGARLLSRKGLAEAGEIHWTAPRQRRIRIGGWAFLKENPCDPLV